MNELVVAFTDSLNVTETVAFNATLVAPSAGDVLVTPGGVSEIAS